MSFLIFVFLFFVNNSIADEITCINNTTKVTLTLPHNGHKLEFCQKSVNGKLVKDGAYIEKDQSGKIIKKEMYREGEKQKKPRFETVGLPSISKEHNSLMLPLDKKIEKIYEFTFGSVFNLLEKSKKEMTISEADRGGCRVSSKNRMNFIMSSKPFKEKRKFRKHCHMEGIIHYRINQDTPVNLKIKNLFNYSSLKYTQQVIRSTNIKKGISIKALIKNAKLLDEKNSESIDFNAEINFHINPTDVLVSRGRKGLFIESGTFEVFKVNGKPYSFKRSK